MERLGRKRTCAIAGGEYAVGVEAGLRATEPSQCPPRESEAAHSFLSTRRHHTSKFGETRSPNQTRRGALQLPKETSVRHMRGRRLREKTRIAKSFAGGTRWSIRRGSRGLHITGLARSPETKTQPVVSSKRGGGGLLSTFVLAEFDLLTRAGTREKGIRNIHARGGRSTTP